MSGLGIVVLIGVPMVILLVFMMHPIFSDGSWVHPGWRLTNPKIDLLIEDMSGNPKHYRLDDYHLESDLVSVWIASGWSFYKDNETRGNKYRLGPFSALDRFRFRRALRLFSFGKPEVFRFQHALRQQERP